MSKEVGSASAEMLVGAGIRVGLAVARFNPYITSAMRELCVERLGELGVDVDGDLIVETPGAYELPLAARLLIEVADVDAVIAIGAVIRGDTDHYDHVASAASQGILRVSVECRRPVIFGVLTTDEVEQAVSRVSHASGYADAAVEMVNRYRMLDGVKSARG